MPTDDLQRIKERALQIAAEIDAKQGPYAAQIVRSTPQWHLLQTAPNKEDKAAEFLVKRRFGVFLPKFEPDAQKKVGGGNLIFPGHLFLFTWDILHHWRRIRACPGVVRIVVTHTELQPIIIPDKMIDEIQALQFGVSPRVFEGVKRSGRKPRNAKYQQQDDDAHDDKEQVLLTTPSLWHDPDPVKRNRLLHDALGLTTEA